MTTQIVNREQVAATRTPPVTAGDNAEAMLKPTLDKIAAGERLAKLLAGLKRQSAIIQDLEEMTRAEPKPLAPADVAEILGDFRTALVEPLIAFAETGARDGAQTEVERPPKRLAEVAKRLTAAAQKLTDEVDYYQGQTNSRVATFPVVEDFGRHAKALWAIVEYAETDK